MQLINTSLKMVLNKYFVNQQSLNNVIMNYNIKVNKYKQVIQIFKV